MISTALTPEGTGTAAATAAAVNDHPPTGQSVDHYHLPAPTKIFFDKGFGGSRFKLTTARIRKVGYEEKAVIVAICMRKEEIRMRRNPR